MLRGSFNSLKHSFNKNKMKGFDKRTCEQVPNIFIFGL